MAAKVNYDAEKVAKITELYNEKGNEGMAEIAAEVGRSVVSVRTKLASLGIYNKPETPVKVAKDTGPTKKEMLNDLEDIVGFDVTGANGATKTFIQSLIDLLVEAGVVTEENEEPENEDDE